jgi:c(7)-type cytochrome triheme protein
MKKFVGIGLVVILVIPSPAWSKLGGSDVKYRPSRAGAVIFSHDLHAAKSVKCSECHYLLYPTVGHKSKATMADMKKGQSCGACHNGQRTFDVRDTDRCTKCHIEKAGFEE